jgi:L-fuculose-phosphate aldolase
MQNKEKKTVYNAIKGLADLSLVTGSQGNVSLRFWNSDNIQSVAITPSGITYDILKPEDIVILDISGGINQGSIKPSIESSLHLEIYKKRDDINAVIHTHSMFASVLSINGRKIPPILHDQIFYLGKEIEVSKPALPGSKELDRKVVSALGSNYAVIIANHGALVVGRSMKQALFNAQLLENVAQMYIYANLTGNINILPDSVCRDLKKMADQSEAKE